MQNMLPNQHNKKYSFFIHSFSFTLLSFIAYPSVWYVFLFSTDIFIYQKWANWRKRQLMENLFNELYHIFLHEFTEAWVVISLIFTPLFHTFSFFSSLAWHILANIIQYNWLVEQKQCMYERNGWARKW